jgi:phosphoribosyl-AMP cyclohydrolase
MGKDKAHIEKSGEFTPKFDADGLVPVIATDAITEEPLMLAYMNAESFKFTLEHVEAVYWSRCGRKSGTRGKPLATPRKSLRYLPITTQTL